MTRTNNPAQDFIDFLYSKIEKDTISLFVEALTPSTDEEKEIPMQEHH